MKVKKFIDALTQAPEYFDCDLEVEGDYGPYGQQAMILLKRNNEVIALLESFEDFVERVKKVE